MALRFEGRTALVTGGARGIGAAIVRRLHDEGANVAITDVLDDEGRALAAELGERTVFIDHDVGDDAAWGAAVQATLDAFGRLDVLVNNAGIHQGGGVVDADLAGVERQFRVNQFGTFLGMRHAFAPMQAAGGGSIVNISSIAGLLGMANSAAYVGTATGEEDGQEASAAAGDEEQSPPLDERLLREVFRGLCQRRQPEEMSPAPCSR